MPRLALSLSLAAVLAACGSSPAPACFANIHPTEVTVAPGDELTFTSSLDGQPAQNQWSTTGGLVDGVGNYTAPSTTGDFTVTVTDKNIAGCSAVAKVHVLIPDAGTPDGGAPDSGP